MRHPINGKNNAIPYTEEPRTGANEDRSVAILDDAGDELRLEQVRLSHWVDLAGRKVEEASICADPKTSATVWKDGADSVAGGFNAQQIVMKCVAVVAID